MKGDRRVAAARKDVRRKGRWRRCEGGGGEGGRETGESGEGKGLSGRRREKNEMEIHSFLGSGPVP